MFACVIVCSFIFATLDLNAAKNNEGEGLEVDEEEV
jgi:hypothetical protein